MAKEPEWKTIRHGRLSVKVAGFDSDEELFAYITGHQAAAPALLAEPEDNAPMAWYLDQLGDG